MYACMYVIMYVIMYVCMYICMHVYIALVMKLSICSFVPLHFKTYFFKAKGKFLYSSASILRKACFGYFKSTVYVDQIASHGLLH